MSEYDVFRDFMKSRLTDFDWKLIADISKGVPQPAYQNPSLRQRKVLLRDILPAYIHKHPDENHAIDAANEQ